MTRLDLDHSQIVTVIGLLAKYSVFIYSGVMCERFERLQIIVFFRGPSNIYNRL